MVPLWHIGLSSWVIGAFTLLVSSYFQLGPLAWAGGAILYSAALFWVAAALKRHAAYLSAAMVRELALGHTAFKERSQLGAAASASADMAANNG